MCFHPCVLSDSRFNVIMSRVFLVLGTLSCERPLSSSLSERNLVHMLHASKWKRDAGYVKLLGAEAYMFGKRAVARWDKEEGTLLFEGVSLPGNCFPPSDTCWLPERSTITFWLKARQSIAAGQTFPVIEAKDEYGGDGADRRPTSVRQ